MSTDDSDNYIGQEIVSEKTAAAREKARSLIRLNLLMNRMDEMSKPEQIALMGLRLWRAANPDETVTKERIEHYLNHANEAINGGEQCRN